MLGLMMLMLVTAGAADLDPALEAKAKQLENQLIAPCCWRAPVSDHYSGAADEIRLEVRALLASGKDEEQVLQSFVGRYGDRILSAPPARGFNLLSWLLPFVALALGGLGVLVYLRSQSPPGAEPAQPASPASDLQPGDQRYARMLEKELKEV